MTRRQFVLTLIATLPVTRLSRVPMQVVTDVNLAERTVTVTNVSPMFVGEDCSFGGGPYYTGITQRKILTRITINGETRRYLGLRQP